jgi:hypothetical protein
MTGGCLAVSRYQFDDVGKTRLILGEAPDLGSIGRASAFFGYLRTITQHAKSASLTHFQSIIQFIHKVIE